MKTYSTLDDCVLGGLEAPCFGNLLPEEIELVKDSKVQVQFRKGESLTKQGAFASSVLFVVEGLVRQYIVGDTNRDFNLRIDIREKVFRRQALEPQPVSLPILSVRGEIS